MVWGSGEDVRLEEYQGLVEWAGRCGYVVSVWRAYTHVH